LFGHPPPDWVVDEVFIGTDRKEYAQVHSASNPHDRKTLATAILRDKRRFVQGQLTCLIHDGSDFGLADVA
jgi:hypothetical protein